MTSNVLDIEKQPEYWEKKAAEAEDDAFRAIETAHIARTKAFMLRHDRGDADAGGNGIWAEHLRCSQLKQWLEINPKPSRLSKDWAFPPEARSIFADWLAGKNAGTTGAP